MTTENGRQHYNLTLAILTMAGTAYALQQTMVFPALSTSSRSSTRLPRGRPGPDGVPAHGLGRDPAARQARRPVREGTDPHRRADDLLIGTIGGAVRVEHRLSDRLSRVVGHRRCGLPAQLRDHPRRVPPEKVKVGIGLLSSVSASAAASGSSSRPDRRVPLVALAVHRGRDPGGGGDPARDRLSRNRRSRRDPASTSRGRSC